MDKLIRHGQCTPSLPEAVVYRDSFGDSLIPYIGEHFRRAYYTWQKFDPSLIQKEKPDVVIIEVVERNFFPATNP